MESLTGTAVMCAIALVIAILDWKEHKRMMGWLPEVYDGVHKPSLCGNNKAYTNPFGGSLFISFRYKVKIQGQKSLQAVFGDGCGQTAANKEATEVLLFQADL